VLNITTMVGLGVGIDYSLLIVPWSGEELNRGLSSADAASDGRDRRPRRSSRQD